MTNSWGTIKNLINSNMTAIYDGSSIVCIFTLFKAMSIITGNINSALRLRSVGLGKTSKSYYIIYYVVTFCLFQSPKNDILNDLKINNFSLYKQIFSAQLITEINNYASKLSFFPKYCMRKTNIKAVH